MKIQLDTNLKVIRLEESVNLGELAEMLNKLLPQDAWKEYKLEVTVLQNWSNPWIIKEWQPISYPWWQFQPYTVTCNTGDSVYNLEVNK